MLSVLYVGFRRGGETGGVKKCSKICVYIKAKGPYRVVNVVVGWSGL